MPSDRAPGGREPGTDAGPRHGWRRWWRSWLPFLVKPLRRGIIIFALLLIVEYLVVPELVGASKDLHLLSEVNAAWLVAGLVLEGARTVVLNVLLWLSLVVSIPLAGFHPIYVTVAIIGAVMLLAVAALALGITRGAERASRILRAVGDRIPGLTGEGVERAFREAAASLSALGRDRRVLARSLTWASLNWLLDAASLWCFVAAFGRLVNPVELFAAYGIANVAGVLPVTPAGLGVIDSVAPLLLVSFGVTRSVATLGVLGWRLVNFWLPIPAGAAAYVSLKVPRGAGLKAMRAAVTALMSRPGPQPENQPPPDRPAGRRAQR
jgi:uncharacterized membrane protein YbhN (UPF0104 family)